ncbi:MULTISPECIES: CsbD family protein [unclassified Streptomyces]|uniref:CsbD family protein n=1 Tax=unclassified Streptomyces TaxID=2593676 RepID=UPI001E3F1931|nr:CsbD family protein [Streptomyces sp. CB02980]MCB8907683.1 CsbD family protein [Streptomyces sp. CB02980]
MADKGRTDKIKGKAKEAVGKVTGNDRMKAEGQMDQVEGKAKEAASDAKDALRGKRDER